MLIPEEAVLRASKWCYRGIWQFITQWMRVPAEPPFVDQNEYAEVSRFRPAEGFLKYMKFYFWIGLVLFDAALFILWIILTFNLPVLGAILALPTLFVMVVPDIVAYIAIHLRYDTTWYVLSDRSMRIRRGIWIIHETTITYENIQNVSVRRGPLEQAYGISNVLVETAGGGAMGGEGKGVTGHSGLLEGVDNAVEIRRLILAKWQQSKSAGLGDEDPGKEGMLRPAGFSEPQMVLLQEIRDLSVELAK